MLSFPDSAVLQSLQQCACSPRQVRYHRAFSSRSAVCNNGVSGVGLPLWGWMGPRDPLPNQVILFAGEGDYHLCYGELGTRVCLIASEPVTGALSDWAEVPRNTALVVCREKAGVLNVVQSPLTAEGVHPRQEEVSRYVPPLHADLAGYMNAGFKPYV